MSEEAGSIEGVLHQFSVDADAITASAAESHRANNARFHTHIANMLSASHGPNPTTDMIDFDEQLAPLATEQETGDKTFAHNFGALVEATSQARIRLEAWQDQHGDSQKPLPLALGTLEEANGLPMLHVFDVASSHVELDIAVSPLPEWEGGARRISERRALVVDAALSLVEPTDIQRENTTSILRLQSDLQHELQDDGSSVSDPPFDIARTALEAGTARLLGASPSEYRQNDVIFAGILTFSEVFDNRRVQDPRMAAALLMRLVQGFRSQGAEMGDMLVHDVRLQPEFLKRAKAGIVPLLTEEAVFTRDGVQRNAVATLGGEVESATPLVINAETLLVAARMARVSENFNSGGYLNALHAQRTAGATIEASEAFFSS